MLIVERTYSEYKLCSSSESDKVGQICSKRSGFRCNDLIYDIVHKCYHATPNRRRNMEKWKKISEYPDYEVSNLGNVRNLKGKTLSPFLINSGYPTVTLYVEGKKKNLLIHRLVGFEFCEGYVEGYTINHIDANRENNRSDNLEWVTYKENIQDMINRGKYCSENARKIAIKSNRTKVDQLTEDGDIIRTFNSIEEACVEVGAHPTKVTAVCRGDRKRTVGYRWRYSDNELREEVERLKGKNRKLVLYSIEGEELGRFDSVKEASEHFRRPTSTLYSHIVNKNKGKSMSCWGHKWEYIYE